MLFLWTILNKTLAGLFALNILPSIASPEGGEIMKQLMPLKRVVVEITHQAIAGDEQGIRKAIRSWHNSLAGGTIPRKVIAKLGRELFLDLAAWEHWLKSKSQNADASGPGRPRSK